MKNSIQKELSKNNFNFVKYGLHIIIIVFVVILLFLSEIQIENKSILKHVINYYFK